MTKRDEKLKSGIYQIVNLINNKVYVGSSVDIKKRWAEHKGYLRKNKHHSGHLQNSWNKYGEDKFKFEIIEYVEKDKLLEREQFHLDKYQSYIFTNGYNICPTAGSSLGRYHSEETKKKIGESHKGKWSGEKNPMYGVKMSEEIRKKMGMAKKGKYVGENCSRSKITEQQAREIKLLLRDSKLFMREIADKVGVSFHTVTNIKRGSCWTHIKI